MLLFDAHNHIHLGNLSPSFLSKSGLIAGAAIMSTHPRDFCPVDSTCSILSDHGFIAVPCYGAHPWFLHEIQEDLNEWSRELRNKVHENEAACVGEIGLDGARWNPETRELATDMKKQQEIFECQLSIASEMDRPVSIHVVRAWGPLFESIKRVKSRSGLPKQMYFHAFAGKPMTLNQLEKACKGSDLLFGFAPVINFRSNKTFEVIKCAGIDRLVLESDLEDSSRVFEDLQIGADAIAKSLGLDLNEVIERTFNNAKSFYRVK